MRYICTYGLIIKKKKKSYIFSFMILYMGGPPNSHFHSGPYKPGCDSIWISHMCQCMLHSVVTVNFLRKICIRLIVGGRGMQRFCYHISCVGLTGWFIFCCLLYKLKKKNLLSDIGCISWHYQFYPRAFHHLLVLPHQCLQKAMKIPPGFCKQLLLKGIVDCCV